MSDSTTSSGKHGREAELQPWQQQPDESAIAYRAFVLYRDMGEERTIVAVAKELGRNPSQMYRRSRRFRWSERIYAWDLAQSEEDETAATLRRRKLRQRNERDAEWFRGGALAALKEILRKDPATGEWTASRELTPREIRILYEMYEKLTDASGQDVVGRGRHKSDAMSRAEAMRRVATYRSIIEELAKAQAAEAEEKETP